MKPIKNIYNQICDFDNLYQAHLSARKGKRFRAEVLAFSANLEENLINIQNELLHGQYAVGRYREFYVFEPKKRLIMALPYKDRVVQWAVYRVVNPILSRGFISDTYACVNGRGAHSAVKRLQYWTRLVNSEPGKPYYLKLDISKYFYRVDHDVLLSILGRKFADERLMALFETIIKSEQTPFGLPLGYNPGEADRLFTKGMPIGNLTSQMFANTYLNELDQHIKRVLRVRHYIRYMDDIIILADDKRLLHGYKDDIERFLDEKLKLTLNNKTAIRPITLGIEFCGYKIWPTHIKLRKSTALKMKRRLKYIQRDYAAGKIDLDRAKRTLDSYQGIMQHCNSYNLRRSIFGQYSSEDPGWFALRKNTPDEAADE